MPESNSTSQYTMHTCAHRRNTLVLRSRAYIAATKAPTRFRDEPIVFGLGNFESVQYYAREYFSGVSINIPGLGEESIKRLLPGTTAPTDGQSYVGRTRSQWMVSCVPELKNGNGQGFRVLLPDGSSYKFDWLASRATANLNDAGCGGTGQTFYRSAFSAMVGPFFGGACALEIAVPRYEVFLYATEVVDRFGNRTNYNFSPSSPFRLLSITHNDDEIMSFGYSGARMISATSKGRTWQYTYQGAGGSLSSVSLPDGSSWSYDHPSALLSLNRYLPITVWQSCIVSIGTKTTSVPASTGDSTYIAITSPSGAAARFDLRRILHGTRQGEADCYYQHNAGGATIGPIVPSPSAYQISSLFKVTLTGPGLIPYERNYSYEPGWTSPYEARTTITDSSGKFQRYIFGGFNRANGKVIREETGAGGIVLSLRENVYLTDPAGQNFPDRVGTNVPESSGWYDGYDSLNVPLILSRETRSGSQFVWSVPSNCDGKYCFDAAVRPTRITRSSSL